MIELVCEEKQETKQMASIKVVGVGGAGGNTVNSIIESGYQGIECIAVNTDAQALELSKASNKIHIGIKSTKGLGTGSNPELGKRSAEEDLDNIIAALDKSDIVFLTAGMGGGTGSGALPVIAHNLKEHGILSIAVVTKPFLFEGKRRSRIADEAVEQLRQEVDTLIVIPNQKLLDVVDAQVSMLEAFAMINNVLSRSVKGISDIITRPGHINVDFADVRTIMKDRGLAVMGTGCASGENRAQEATLQAIMSPLLENMNIEGAEGVLINITGSKDLGLHEISEAASIIYEKAHEDANIILGSVIDDAMGDEIAVTIIATGFNQEETKSEVSHDAFVQASRCDEELACEPKTEAVVEQLVVQMATPSVTEESQADTIEDLPIDEPKAKQCESPSDFAEASSDRQEFQEAMQEPDVPVQEMMPEDCAIDMDDMDIPTFMRKNAEQKVEKE